MPIEITMPRLSDTMEQGTVVSWNVKEGQSVSAGETLGDIETDKATMELQNFEDGTVAAILLDEGKTVSVGSIIMVLAEEDEDPAQIKSRYADGAGGGATEQTSAKEEGGASSAAPQASTAVAEGSAAPSGAAAEEPTNGRASGSGGRIFASPLAKKIAREKGLDLSTIEGTGP